MLQLRSYMSRFSQLIRSLCLWLLQTAFNACFIILLLYLTRYVIPPLSNHMIYHGREELIVRRFVREEQMNDIRLEKARSYLAEGNLTRFNIAKDSKRLTISIVASRRPNRELTQLLGYISFYLNDNYKVLICNAEVDSTNRPQEIREFEQFLEVIDLNINGNPVLAPSGNTYDNQLHKESLDYWRCLNISYGYGMSDYILLLEDDALPTAEFNVAINSVMRQLDRLKDIDYVKLFHPWRLRGIPSYVQASALVLFLSYFLQLLLWKDRNLFVILAVALFTHKIFRMHFFELFADAQFYLTQSAYLSLPESCCTQAVLFRGTKVQQIVEELGNQIAKKGHAKDHILDDSRFVGRATDANFVVHIGYFSYLRKQKVPLGNKR
ncbi:transmembrane protein [Ditylenchus destructor]|uniref:Transmembrane protein n=1 Tax=Ditylenchus destructor TaxID=166010 RepID=A0AAD4R638_9BILA|nr:transmembrane protein [Ditylenchus destructor]